MVFTVRDRPDLAEQVASWLFTAFWRDDGFTLAEVRAVVAGATARVGPTQCFIVLNDGVPVATASLAPDDLDERPDLTPWLAGVYVVPEARRRGHARTVIAAVEAAGRDAGVSTLWLYTNGAEALYAKLGWREAERVPRLGKPTVTLMRRDL